MTQRLIVLGSTGSIGASALEVAADFPDRFRVAALSTHQNVERLAEQARLFAPEALCISGLEEGDPRGAALEELAPRLYYGPEGLKRMARETEAETCVAAVVGFAGLAPTLAAVERGLRIALANKEVLVVAGELVTAAARRSGAEILPVDSEHNAIFQCLAGSEPRQLRRLVLTASGGPFRGARIEDLERVTPDQALAHPTWNMGPKITIDSATLMNKGLEVIEACHLFDVAPGQVEVVVHPQSRVHSMVEFSDGSVLAQLGQTDMYLPILSALAWPERPANKFPPLDLTAAARLDFEPPDREAFPCLDYAYEAIGAGGALPAVLSAANEIAVEAFLAGRITFPGIAETIRHTMDRFAESHPDAGAESIESLSRADRKARAIASDYAGLTGQLHR